MSFGNLAGAWALVGLLAVLAIHFLQRRSRTVVITTLFLLDPLAPRPAEGTRLQRLRSSPSLWLQLLSVLVLTWLLLAPRFLRAESVQRVVVVLDASASMGAFREPMRAALDRRIQALSRGAARTEWILMDTALGQRTLFNGTEAAGLRRAVEAWTPLLGSHDVSPSLDVARTLAGGQGRVVFVTDHVTEATEGIELLAVGSPVENVGFVGVQVDAERGEATFRVLVQNHGRQAAVRSFHAEAGAWKGPATALNLAAGAIHAVTGTFPPGQDRFELVLEADRFTLDDRLPLVRPRPKPLRVQVTAAAEAIPFVPRFLETLDAVVRVGAGTPTDLVLRSSGDPPSAVPAIVLGAGAGSRAGYLQGPIVAEAHALVADLNWQGLLVRQGAGTAAAGDDRGLVWQGARPLVLLRGREPAAQLVVDFSLADSNADRLPALPLLLHRYAESVRAAIVGHEQANVETGQRLSVAAAPGGPPLKVEVEGTAAVETDPGLLRAPARPGFFRVVQADAPRLTAAAHFADAREADLSQAASREEPGRPAGLTVTRNSRQDPLTPLWVLLLGGLLVADWRRQARAARGR